MLFRSLSQMHDGKPVVFHDARGGFAPVIDDPERIHVQIHGTPTTAKGGRTEPRAVRAYPGGHTLASGNRTYPRVPACASRELENADSHIETAKNIRLMQRKDTTWFLLVRPVVSAREAAATDGPAPICPEATANAIFHAMFARRVNPVSAHGQQILNTRPANLVPRLLETVEGTYPSLAPIAGALRDMAITGMVRRVLDQHDMDPAFAVSRRIQDLQGQLESRRSDQQRLQQQIAEARQRQQEIGMRRGVDAYAEWLRQQMREIGELPQVEHVAIEQSRGNPVLLVRLKPMTLGRHIRRDPGCPMVAPMEIRLNPQGHGPDMLAVSDIYGSRAPAAHVRGGACLGSLGEGLQDTLRNGQIASAVQLAIGFLQTYNAQDTWGAIGTRWPALNIETGRGNTACLPLPPAETPETGGTDTAETETTHAETAAEPEPAAA